MKSLGQCSNFIYLSYPQSMALCYPAFRRLAIDRSYGRNCSTRCDPNAITLRHFNVSFPVFPSKFFRFKEATWRVQLLEGQIPSQKGSPGTSKNILGPDKHCLRPPTSAEGSDGTRRYPVGAYTVHKQRTRLETSPSTLVVLPSGSPSNLFRTLHTHSFLSLSSCWTRIVEFSLDYTTR